MIRQFDIRSSRSYPKFMVRNTSTSSPGIEKAVAAIIRRVERSGDDALRFYTKKFDGAALSSLAVSEKEIRNARAERRP